MKVSLPYDHSTWEVHDWAKENCPSYITNYASYGSDITIHYCFGNERDVIAFTLRWV